MLLSVLQLINAAVAAPLLSATSYAGHKVFRFQITDVDELAQLDAAINVNLDNADN